MAGTIGVMLIACIIFAVILYFKLRPGVPNQERKAIILTVFVIILLLIVNCLLSWRAYVGLRCLRDTSVITHTAELTDVLDRCSLVVQGIVSSENGPVRDNYVACVEDGLLFFPSRLVIDLEDGQIALSNNDFKSVGWPFDNSGRFYLSADLHVVLVCDPHSIEQGPAENNVRVMSTSVIFVGTHDAFVQRSTYRCLIAGSLTIMNLALIIVIFLLSTAYLLCRRP